MIDTIETMTSGNLAFGINSWFFMVRASDSLSLAQRCVEGVWRGLPETHPAQRGRAL